MICPQAIYFMRIDSLWKQLLEGGKLQVMLFSWFRFVNKQEDNVLLTKETWFVESFA